MRAKAIAARRQKLAELARKDRANRCAMCKRELKAEHVQMFGLANVTFCSHNCLTDWIDGDIAAWRRVWNS